MSRSETIGAIYAAFGRGDVPGILAHLHEDVEWEYGGGSTAVPWLQPRRGHAGAVEFFTALAQGLEVRRFDVKGIFEQGDVVLGLVDLEAVARATGRTVLEEDEVHVWRFRGDKVARFRHRSDTALQAQAID